MFIVALTLAIGPVRPQRAQLLTLVNALAEGSSHGDGVRCIPGLAGHLPSL
jgi:hypothetical protein